MTSLRGLPSVERLISDEGLKSLRELYPHALLVGLARTVLEEKRRALAVGEPLPEFESLVDSVRARAQLLARPSLQRVINATGVILHTNLGRAPLSKEAIEAMKRASEGYSNLEFDLKSGQRGSRQAHIGPILRQLTGVEAALVVNNNAAAVLLSLAALARGKEVIVSRGHSVEIGGGFRIPEIMRQSGARLVEVGTTNRTYVSDYRQAISPKTAALLRVHSSNFKMVGFTQAAGLKELVDLGQEFNIPVIDDIGSGSLLDTTGFGLEPEPRVQDSVLAGAGLVLFSGDKLVGGPQAGIVVGKAALVDRVGRHPLARAVRIDKVSLAGLQATLLHYLKEEATVMVPVWQMISAPLEVLEQRARGWVEDAGGLAKLVKGESVVGGGSLPGNTLPTWLAAIKLKEGVAVHSLAEKLRLGEPPVVGRVHGDALLLDPRSVLPDEDEKLNQALRGALAALNPAYFVGSV